MQSLQDQGEEIIRAVETQIPRIESKWKGHFEYNSNRGKTILYKF